MKYEVRELNLGGVLDQAISLTKNQFGQLFSIVAVTLLPVLAVQSAVEFAIMPSPPTEASFESIIAYANARNQAMASNRGLVMGMAVLSFLMIPMANAAIIHTVASTYLGKQPTIGESLGMAFNSIVRLYWTWLLVMFAIMGGLICLIIPGILAMFWFSLATQVVVIERIGGFAALKRSRHLMKGNIGRIFVLFLILGAISIGLQMVSGFIPQRHAEAIMNVVIQGVLMIFNSAALVVFYFSARCRHEQFDLQLLAENLSVGRRDAESEDAMPQFQQ